MIKDMVCEDTYLPHASEELAALVTEGLLAEEVYSGLNPGRPYGIAYYGRTRGSYVSVRSKKRKVEPVPRREWTAVPVDLSDSGLERGRVERARRATEDNRVSSKAGGRVWELSRGFLYCADCGRSMTTHTRGFPEKGTAHHYYRCRPSSTLAECPNRRSHPAVALEYEAAKMFEMYASREVLLELYDRAIAAEEESSSRAILERRAALTRGLSELNEERKNYLRLAAKGRISDDDLDDMLEEIDTQRAVIEAELVAVEEQAKAVQRMQAARNAVADAASYNPVNAEWAEDPDAVHPGEYLTLAASQDEIRRAYGKYGARFEVGADRALTLRLSLALGGNPLHLHGTPW